MSVLILTDESRALANEVIAFAEAHRITLAQIQELMETHNAVGEETRYTCVIPLHYRCCFSIEEQPFGWSRHLSISVPIANRLPHPMAVTELMGLFGFKSDFYGANYKYFEGVEAHQAINIIERYDPLV